MLKKFLFHSKFSIIILLFFLSYSSFSQIEPHRNFIEKLASYDMKSNKARFAMTPSTQDMSYDLKYERIYLELNPEVYYVKGNVTFYYIKTSGAEDTINFDLHSSLEADSVCYHGSKCSFLHKGDILSIFGIKSNIGRIDSLTVYYRGIPEKKGFGSFTQGLHADSSIVWTLSEPYGAKTWMPCKESLSDKIDSLDIFVRSPSKYKVASNGLLISITSDNGFSVTHWKQKYPIATYLIGVSVTDYEVFSEYAKLDKDSVYILNYVYPENLEDAKEFTKDIIPVIQLYSKLFIPYPFIKEKYGHAQFGWGGGMEHQTMSFMTDFSHELMAHELAHSWFGNMITCGSWQDIWLNEGFATYLTGLTYERMFNGIYWDIWKINNINAVTQYPGGSVFVYDTTTVDRVFDSRLSYSKGAMVLHQLRWILGDFVFFNAINNYLTDTALAYKFAKTPDLIKHFEKASGKNLKSYFDTWIYGEGFPIYDAVWEPENNDMTVHLSVNQKTSLSSIPLFDLPVEIELKGENNYDTLIIIQPSLSFQEYYFNTEKKVTQIIFDPHHWLICNSNIFEKLQQDPDIKIYPNPARKYLSIEYRSNNFSQTIYQIEILDMAGKVIYKDLSTYSPWNKISIPLTLLSKGIYFLRININNSSDKNKAVYKFFVEDQSK